MLIAYDSRTGNVKRFIDKLNMRTIKIDSDIICNEPYILVTYTTGMGAIPQKTLDFLNNNSKLLQAVASSGNRNWGLNFAKSADSISQLYNIPILLKFELSGTPDDIQKFSQRVIQFEAY